MYNGAYWVAVLEPLPQAVLDADYSGVSIAHSRSMTVAMPWPTPMHIVARP